MKKNLLYENVAAWYRKAYPQDADSHLWQDFTFAYFFNWMVAGNDVYVLFGFRDTLIRERVFAELAKRMGCDYEFIYDIWLNF